MNLLTGLFGRRVRGFRVIDLMAFACLSALVLGVYAFKAHAGGQSAKIAEVDGQIADEDRRIRLLNAELAHLEQPERLERLSGQYLGLGPVDARREITPDGLMEVARQAATPAPTPGKAPAKLAVAARPDALKPATAKAVTAKLATVKPATVRPAAQTFAAATPPPQGPAGPPATAATPAETPR